MQMYLAETDGHNAARFVRKDGRWMGGFEGFDGCMDGRILGAVELVSGVGAERVNRLLEPLTDVRELGRS